MRLSTIGISYHASYEHPLYYDPDDNLESNRGQSIRFRLLLIHKGTGIVQLNGQPLPLVTPAAYCLNERDSMHIVAGAGVQAESLYFHPSIINGRLQLGQSKEQWHSLLLSDEQDVWCLEPFLNREHAQSAVIPVDPSIAKHMGALMADIGQVLSAQRDGHWPCRSRSYAMELLFLIRRIYDQSGWSADRIPDPTWDKISLIIQYLYLHYPDKIKLEHLTAKFYTNKTTLNHLFRAHTGYSVISYLNRIRMQVSSAMLRNTLLPTDEIMTKTGFQDDAHFIRSFRKYSGYSPAEYRNSFCWMLK